MSSQTSPTVMEDRGLSSPFFSLAAACRRGHDLWARFIAARRQRRILGLIGLLWFFSAFDLVLTIWADRFTVFYEANPIARAMLANGMIKSVVLLKLMTLTAGSALFWGNRNRRWTEGVLWALASGYVVLMFQWSAYTANADELMHYRQMADFATTPVTDDIAYLRLVRRARDAERSHPGAVGLGAIAAPQVASAQQPPRGGVAWALVLEGATPAHRTPAASPPH